MKKFIYYLSVLMLFVFVQQVQSQEENSSPWEDLIANEWYLTKLIMNGDELLIPIDNDEQSILRMEEIEDDNEVLMTVVYCNNNNNTSIYLKHTSSDFYMHYFTELASSEENPGCGSDEAHVFINTYLYEFWENEIYTNDVPLFPFHFSYTITEFDDYQQLIVINDNGDEAHFQNVPNMSVEKHQQNNLLVYPNPVKDFIHIENLTERADVKIYNLLGKQIFQQEIHSPDESLDVSNLSIGLYFYSIFQNGKSVKTGKLVKE